MSWLCRDVRFGDGATTDGPDLIQPAAEAHDDRDRGVRWKRFKAAQ